MKLLSLFALLGVVLYVKGQDEEESEEVSSEDMMFTIQSKQAYVKFETEGVVGWSVGVDAADGSLSWKRGEQVS